MVLGVVGAVLLATATADAADYYTLVVSGASGDPTYVETYDRWRQTLVMALRAQAGFRDDHLTVLAETPGPGVGRASREGVIQAVSDLRGRMTDESVLLVVLLGHGTYDGVDAKFNLVGPDLEARAWSRLLDDLPGHLVFVNTTAASFPFVQQLAQPGRVVITATESAVQRYDTVFPEFFVQALSEPSADSDKDGRVSVMECFAFASDEVRRWYQREGRLATERPLLDDTGDGVATEAGQRASDGILASRLYVEAGVEAPPVVSDPTLMPLVNRREELEDLVAGLRARKDAMARDAYQRELEQLLVDLARVSREIRRRTSTS